MTLPDEFVQAIDLHEENRSRFILEAVRRELLRRQRQLLLDCLQEPHASAQQYAELGFEEWIRSAAPEDDLLVDPARVTPVRWDPTSGGRQTACPG